MTQITIFQNQNHDVVRFTCFGHAGFAEAGHDIVCAGISILVLNTINAIEQFTDDDFTCDVEEESGAIDFRFHSVCGADAKLLIRTMILGLEGIQSSYGKNGKKYLKLQFKEV